MTSLRIKPHLIALSCWGHFARERHLHFNLKNSMYSTRKVTWLQAAKDLLCTGVLTRQAREPITWNSLCRQQSELCVKNLNWSVDFEMWKNMSKRQQCYLNVVLYWEEWWVESAFLPPWILLCQHQNKEDWTQLARQT